jgi:hypothetical protein
MYFWHLRLLLLDICDARWMGTRLDNFVPNIYQPSLVSLMFAITPLMILLVYINNNNK